jgi:hypothetical protein
MSLLQRHGRTGLATQLATASRVRTVLKIEAAVARDVTAPSPWSTGRVWPHGDYPRPAPKRIQVAGGHWISSSLSSAGGTPPSVTCPFEEPVVNSTAPKALVTHSRDVAVTRHPTTGSGQAAGLSLSGSLCQARCSS